MTLDALNYEAAPALPSSTVAHAILTTLASHGITAAFGIPGGLIAPLFDAINDIDRLNLVNTKHEGVAAFAAIGYYFATGHPALVLTTGGPGITNALTGIAAAKEEHAPLIFIGGDVPAHASGRSAVQDGSANALDVVSIMRNVTKAAMRIEHADAALGIIEQAVKIAMTAPRGPVFIALPVNVSGEQTAPLRLAHSSIIPASVPDAQACRELARALVYARRPLIIAGNGARTASTVLLELAERVQCPVVTTPHSKGVFPDSHPLHLGSLGLGGHPSATRYLESEPDVVCILGSRAGDLATNGWSIPWEGTKSTFQIDHQPKILGRNAHLSLGIVSDVRAALERTLRAVPVDRLIRTHLERRTFLRPETMESDQSPITPARALRELQIGFPDATWFADVGEHCAYALHYLTINRPEDFFHLMGFRPWAVGWVRRSDMRLPVRNDQPFASWAMVDF